MHAAELPVDAFHPGDFEVMQDVIALLIRTSRDFCYVVQYAVDTLKKMYVFMMLV